MANRFCFTIYLVDYDNVLNLAFEVGKAVDHSHASRSSPAFAKIRVLDL